MYLCTMRVLIVNTSERTGGAAVAASRLMEALNNNGVKAKMLVRDKETDRLTVAAVPGQKWMQFYFLWERFVVWLRLHFNRKHLFEVDIANCGADVTQLPEFQEADVVHLHWINQGMLSLKGIRKILNTGKPVVWTMHDIWPATNDLSTQIWKRKQQMLNDRQITFVTCSQWLAGEAQKSALLKGQRVVSIPNPIDTHIYTPKDKQQARQRVGLPTEGRIILFASQRVTNRNKGMGYLLEACRLLAEQYPEKKEDITVAILGGHAEEIEGQLPFRTCPLGYVNDEQRIVDIYNAADVFVLPSLSENLPNTIMEAMACGVPSVGFRIGGIPEEIDHQQNGYVADYCSSEDLARGIWWTLYEADHEAVRKACLQKVAHNYSQQSVANRYLEVYESLHRHNYL